jgi:hypothetical protein
LKKNNIGSEDNYKNYRCLLGALYPLWHLSFTEIHESIDDDQYVYHYTSLKALDEILETKSFTLKPASYQNDPKEGKAFFKKLSDYIFDNIEKSQLERLRDWLKRLDNKSIEDTLTYIYCFTKNVDYIPMWNSSYGHNGEGCAIGIDKAKINKTKLKLTNRVNRNDVNKNKAQLYKIIYIRPKFEF